MIVIITRILTAWPFRVLSLFTAAALLASGCADSALADGVKSDPPACLIRLPSSGARDVKMPAGARTSVRILGLQGLRNVGRVAPGICRGAMPAPEGYATLKRMGIRTVVNLRTSESEKKRVEAAGMQSVEIPLNMLGNGDVEKVERVVEIMADQTRQPVFVHCKLGEDRTGIVVAAYRMKVEGWPLGLAMAEMEQFGFNDVWVNLKHFLKRYAALLEQRKQPERSLPLK